ncbi:MAG TPA: acyltransferase [Cellvibrio sp.]|nr:acyltransferase [Cellvibrio sp.]
MEIARSTPLPPQDNPHQNRDKMPNLDGIRAMACLFVIVSHMPWPVDFILIGSVGVGVFFALSGFLMGYLYAQSECDSTAVVKYGIARFSRIAPIYWLVISICILLSQFEPDSFPLTIEGATAITRHYLFSGNVSIFWSIPLEVQYYAFFLFVWWCIASRHKYTFAMPLVLLVCALFVLTHAYWPNLSVPNKLHFFLAGTIAGLLPRKAWVGRNNRIMLCLLQVAALATIFLPLALFSTIPEMYDSVEMSIAFAIAIYLLSISSGWTSLVFAAPLMRKIGQASFSIYLVHVLVFYYGGHLLGLEHRVFEPLWLLLGIAGVAIPMVVSHYIEMPLQRFTRKRLEVVLLDSNPRPVAQTQTS